MRNLGKIVVLILLLTDIIYAGVRAEIDPKIVYAGDSVTYKLHITGGSVKKPLLSDICGNDITATSSQTSIQSINGNYQKSYTLSYAFTPQKSCVIAPIELEIDSKLERSNSVEVNVKPRTQDLNADFVLSLEASKKELFVGEPFTLTLSLKQKDGVNALDNKFVPPEFKGFWMKSQSDAKQGRGSGYSVTKVEYILAPQREGNLTIEPAQLKIATRSGGNNWGTFIPQVKWQSYYSNPLELKVHALPNGAKIIGDFHITASADRKEVNVNEPVNVTLLVEGVGNLEDIESFKPYVDGVNVFDEKILIQGDSLTQKLVFVGENNFTIPSFELDFFNTKTQKVQKIRTEPIDIQVSGTPSKSEVKIKRDKEAALVVKKAAPQEVQVEKHVDYKLIVAAFVVGLVAGALLISLFGRRAKKRTKKFNLKDEKLLLMKLLPFKDEDKDVQTIVDILENNLYEKEKKSLDKKLLKELVKRYDIS